MSENNPKDSPEQSRKKAMEALARMDIEDRIERRREGRRGHHSLLTVLMPLWIWMLGLAFLPDESPLFARALFHASCWGGFAWLAFSAWRKSQEESPVRKARASRELEEDIERARRRREIRDS